VTRCRSTGSCDEKNCSGCPRKDFLEGGGDSGIPISATGIPRKTGFAVSVIRKFRAMEDGVDAAVPVDAKERVHKRLGKLHKPQFSTAPPPITVSYKRKGNNEERCTCANLIVSTEGFTPHECARECARTGSNDHLPDSTAGSTIAIDVTLPGEGDINHL
jgi:hypothetical protein